jgi:enoyl-CoA hydratase/carnithine racemase
MSEVLYDKSGGIAVLTLNRPERMNAISGPMLRQFSERLVEADRDRGVRAIVVTGAGRAFCAGLDMKEGTASLGSGDERADRPPPGELDLRDAPPVVLHKIDTPTVCALNGGAAGYGMDLALGCDIRIAAESAKLAPAFVRRGILPESGGTWLLPRLVGWAKAAEIAFTGDTLDAKQCLDLGLVNKVVSDATLMDEATALAERIAANAPLAVRATKRMMRAAWDEPFEEHVHHVFLQLLPLFQSRDFREGMAAFVEKRTAEFEGR